MEQEKEGEGTSVLNTITEAAKTSMEATIEGVSSAATNIVDAVTGRTEKPRRRRTRSSTKKARGKAKRTSTRRTSSAAATRRSTRKTAASKRTGRGTQAKRNTSKSRTSKARERSTKSRSR
jgi:hypothetical protein